MGRLALAIGALGALAVLLTPAVAHANRESAALRARASDELYNLDRDLALATYRQAIAADPQDAGAYRGLASVAVAEHHVPPRQHDRGRLPRPGDEAEHPDAAGAA